MVKSLDVLQTYARLRDQAADNPESSKVQSRLEAAKNALVQEAPDSLGNQIICRDPSILTQLHNGRMTLTAALGSGALAYSADTETVRGDRAAEFLSVISELEDTDPVTALQITRAIAMHKIGQLLPKVTPEQSAEAQKPESSPTKTQEVEERALSLARNSTVAEVAAYLSKFTDADTAAGIMKIYEFQPKLAGEVLRALPGERRTSLTLGRLSSGREGMLGIMPVSMVVHVVRRQLQNDNKPESGLTDRNNMTAPYFLWKTLQNMEKTEEQSMKDVNGNETGAKEQKAVEDKARKCRVFAALGKSDVDQLLNGDYSDSPFSMETAGAQEELREFFENNKSDIALEEETLMRKLMRKRSQAAAGTGTVAVEEPALTVADIKALADEIDLDQI